jgi:hypothetical protein
VVYRPLEGVPTQVELDLVWRHGNENPAFTRLMTELAGAGQDPFAGPDSFPVSIHP